MSPVIAGNIDVALLVLYAFFLFFIGLVIHLRRENRREGFPLEDESGRLVPSGVIPDGGLKTFKLPFGRGTATNPARGNEREAIDLPVRRERFPGSPLVPTGNPLIDGIGPAAWADRAKLPDLDMEGHPRIVPISATNGITVEKRDANPVGMTVIAADGVSAGTVTDIWVDRADRLIRYLAVDIGTRTVLAPFVMSKVNRRRNVVVIDAITAAQFADAPVAGEGGTITLYDEDRVQAYFGGGYLYATPERSEPLL